MKGIIITLFIVLTIINTFSFAQDDNTIFVSSETIKEVSLTYDEIKKLSVKKIRKLLHDRGLTCKGCTEKEEFAQMAYDNIDLPVKINVPSPKTEDTKEDKDRNIDELMEKLKGSGFNGNMFNMKDFEGMSPEDMAEKMGGGGSRKKKGSKKYNGGEFREPKKNKNEKKKATPKWRSASDDEFIQDDNIEL